MPIDKLTPRQLDADSDSKLIEKTAMLDALNLYSGETGGNGGDGDMGVLKNIKGNTQISELGSDALPEDARIIGKVEDKKTGLVYLFVYSATAAEQGVWAYDPLGRLPESEVNSLRLIYKSAQFNFPQDGFVKSDLIYSNSRTEESLLVFGELGVDFDKDVIIYFTDNDNEPRKINAYRAFLAGGSAIHGDDKYAEADFITACPKSPVKPISFLFRADPSKKTNDFLGVPGFQFAYQRIYKDGMESAISCYSDIAFPPSVINQGASPNPYHNSVNECVLTIPYQGPEIKSIRLLAKQGNTGNFLVIDEIDSAESETEYSFYNDRLTTGVSTDEVNKQFDAVPRKAQAQTSSSNRMMYGNYLDGFDNVKTSCTATLKYKERPEDFVDFNIKVLPSIGVHEAQDDFNEQDEDGVYANAIRMSSGFFLDCRNLPPSVSADSNFEVKLSFSPDRNWHIYNSDGGYHQSRQVGFIEQVNVDVLYSSINEPGDHRVLEPAEAGSTKLLSLPASSQFSCWGLNGVNSISGDDSEQAAIWHPEFQPNDEALNSESINNSPFPVKIGSSAGSPLILAGGSITFSVKFTCLSDIEGDFDTRVSNLLGRVFAGEDNDDDGFNVTESNIESSYEINLGLEDGSKIKQSFILGEGGDAKSKLIIPIANAAQVSGAPQGYVIINKATPVFGIEEAKNEKIGPNGIDFRPSGTRSFVFKLKSLGESPEVHTCIRSAFYFGNGANGNPLPQPNPSFGDYPLDWLVISKNTLESDAFSDIGSFLSENGYPPILNADGEVQSTPEEVFGLWAFANPSDGSGGNEFDIQASNQGWVNQVGYITDPSSIFNPDTAGVCLMDGEGGPGGGISRGGGGNQYDKLKLFSQGSVSCTPVHNFTEGANLPGFDTQRNNVFHYGKINTQITFGGSNEATSLPLIQKGTDDGAEVYPIPEEGTGGIGELLTTTSVNFKPLHSFTEVLSQAFNFNVSDDGSRTFKSNANHDFGVVYYDERGRHGFVNHLKTVFVPDYSSQGRSEYTEEEVLEGGAVAIDLSLNHDPPEWAHYYKIVYAKNTSVKDFVQYASGGAFASEIQQEITQGEGGNIYVSLNYLQGHPLSYVSSFGARTPEGGLNFYKFEEGDRLIVISAFNGDQREYYSQYEFEVVGQVKLGETDNPIALEPEENQMGDFVIVRNNPNALGFTYTDVKTGNHKWGNNCIIELRSPFKEVDLDKRLFYEIGDTYDVVIADPDFPDQVSHGTSTIHLDKGDVWFRRVPLNTREQPDLEDLITDSDVDEDQIDPLSNFKSYYLESNTATDLYRADSSLIGRPNVILENALETIREATITYSDPSNPESRKVNYSSFNSSLANFKDLSEKHGSINYLSDQSDSIVAIQENKVVRIPVGRSLISDAKGSSSLVTSRNVLGEAIHYPGESGCDNDPSSVADIEEAVFFANKSLGKVYRFDKNAGVKVVSDDRVAALFRNMFKQALSDVGDSEHVRVVGGYDPVKEEYLVTVVSLENKTAIGVEEVNQHGGEVTGTGTGSEEAGLNLSSASVLDLVQEFLERPNDDKFLSLAQQITIAEFNELRAYAPNVVSADLDISGNVANSDLLRILAAFGVSYDDSQLLIPPSAGTLQSQSCSGVNLVSIYADGNGGTYEETESNSLSCGFEGAQNTG